MEARLTQIFQIAGLFVFGGGVATTVPSFKLNVLAAIILLSSVYIGGQFGYLAQYQEYTDELIRMKY